MLVSIAVPYAEPLAAMVEPGEPLDRPSQNRIGF